MLENIIQSGNPAIDRLLKALEASDLLDRLLLRNLRSDLRLNDKGFDADDVRGNIVTFFARWLARYDNLASSPRTFCGAYSAVVDEDNKVPDDAPDWMYRRLFLLGYDTRRLHPALGGRWVGFMKYRPSSEDTIAKRNRNIGRDQVEASIRGTCRYKKFLWVASHESLRDTIAQCEVEGDLLRFDALRDCLGLNWTNKWDVIVGVVFDLEVGEPLARVPSFFDACGYPFFRPASPDWFEQYGCGSTCPINAPHTTGVGELVVWVGDNDPPSHTGVTGSMRDDWSVLEDGNGNPLLFTVRTNPDLDSYILRRE